MKKVVSFQCILCVFITLFLFPVLAGAEQVILAYDEYPPLNYTENGKAQGLMVDWVREAGKRLGVKTVFIARPFIRAMEESKFRGVDGILTVVKTKERQEYLYFPSISYAFDGPVLFAHSQSGVTVNSLEDTRGLVVGVIRGYSYGGDVLEMLTGELRVVKDGDTLYKMIAERRFDLGLGYKQTGAFYLNKIKDGDQVEAVLALPEVSLHLAFSKKLGPHGQELTENFAREIEQIMNERKQIQ
nr:transporter substrate-binding domain-containing protein [uncultured Pseudodesulfovibrio sp.]